MSRHISIYFVTGFIIVSVFLASFISLYNFDDEAWRLGDIYKGLVFGWQTRTSAKFFSRLALNSRIYKGFLLYEANKDRSNLPTGLWLGETVDIVGVDAARGIDMQQTINKDSVELYTVFQSWDKQNGLLKVTLRGKDMTLKIENFTLIYQLSREKGKQLIGRGPNMVADLLRVGQNLDIFVIDEGVYPVVLDLAFLSHDKTLIH